MVVAAFVGGLAATTLVYALSRSAGRTEIVTLVLTGIAVNAIGGALIGLFAFVADDAQLRSITFWNLGSVGSASWRSVGAVAPVAVAGLLLAPRFARQLDLLALGERSARHLGVDVERLRALLIVVGAMLTAAAVAVSGIVAFVGLVVPPWCACWRAPVTGSCFRAARCSGRSCWWPPTSSRGRSPRPRRSRWAWSPRWSVPRSSCGCCGGHGPDREDGREGVAATTPPSPPGRRDGRRRCPGGAGPRHRGPPRRQPDPVRRGHRGGTWRAGGVARTQRCGEVDVARHPGRGHRSRGGPVEVHGHPLDHLAPLELARRRAVLPQSYAVSFPFTVRQVVEMGRAPWAATDTADQDDAAITDALHRTDVAELADRRFPTLSGGERARVALARALAQRTPILLLDEPTAALDLHHQQLVLQLARQRAQAGDAVVVVLHDLALAAAHVDRVVILRDGRVAAEGTPTGVLRADLLSAVYGHPVEVLLHPRTGTPLVLPRTDLDGPGGR